MRAVASGISLRTPKSERPAESKASETSGAPPFRLRFLLLAGLAYGAYSLVSPRVTAAWTLHSRATALADYGACMAGPTGPGLLRDHQQGAFETLVRRRLVTATPAEAPFERCAKLALTLTDSTEVESAHRARAASFAEYGASERSERTLGALAVSAGGLAELARAAWPFTRGYAMLVKPSLGAKEAPHPVAPPAVAAARGLPTGRPLYRAARVEGTTVLVAAGAGAHGEALRSTDGGATFRPVSTARVEDFAGRCPAGSGGRAFTLGAGADGGSSVVSSEPGAEPRVTPLGRATEEVVSLACDEQALVAALRVEGRRETMLRQCAFGAPCAALPAPKFAGTNGSIAFPIDVARVSGTTIVALAMGGVVRVTSSRDGGASWSPFSVAFDSGESSARGVRVPSELFAIGRRVLLYAAPSRAGETVPLLYSDDQGASWHGR
ncbi:MAG TPA: sialidase family protein [Polyangiaceae bacterium]